MFDYPLPVPRQTSYQLLGLGPEATTEEIREAIQDLGNQIKEDKLAVERQLETIRQAVPGLSEAVEAVRRLQASDSDDPAERTEAERRLRDQEQQAITVHPNYRDLGRRARELEDRLLQINRLTLQNPEERQKYNQAHPPLELLELEDASTDAFTDNRVVLPLLRRELASLLESQGEEVFHPSDLTRTDFTADYQPNSLLDES